MTTTTHISTSSVSVASRLSLMNLQNKLQVAQEEMATSRLADVGLTLGFRTGETVSMRQEVTRLQTITDTNGIAKSRLDTSDVALKGIADSSQTFLGNLFLARNGGITGDALAGVARDALASFTDAANTTFNGTYLFSGINTDVKPITPYYTTPPSAAQTAVGDAFYSAFGMSQDDPNVANITADDMKTFLDGAFSDLFNSTQWNTMWSGASDQNLRSRISTSEVLDTSTNANTTAFKNMVQAYTMVADLGAKNLNADAYQAVLDKAIEIINKAQTDMTRVRTEVGAAQARIGSANDRMAIQINVLNLNVGSLEGVDPAEVSTRVSSLLSQMETAYAVTARIQRLSILNYIPVS